MSMCKGICVRFKATSYQNPKGRYASGQKRCKSCSIFITHDQIRCPCCGHQLRAGPRSRKLRRAYRLLENQ